MLKKLEEASEKAEPLDEIAARLKGARETATKWVDVNTEQKMREAIAEALEPLKNLKDLVDAETHRSIQSLSSRIGTILNDIRLKDRFDFENTELNKRRVMVHGGFGEDYKIDAQLVANASWLRAVLWAFVFAMREEAIKGQGGCSFPLVVLDDPQITFDPKNKRKWAEKIVKLANADASQVDGIQLFLATHERQFFDIVTATSGLRGEKGMIARPHGKTGVAQILNGTNLERGFAKAKDDDCDEQGRNYVRDAMMEKVSDAFVRITRGAFRALAAANQQFGILPGRIRADGSSIVASKMSRGTRFQLYLALRIAGYDEFAKYRETLPFFADDVLEPFDNERSAETFLLLHEMSKRGQVVYLTHHRHLCGIAKSVCGDGVVIHELPDPVIERTV